MVCWHKVLEFGKTWCLGTKFWVNKTWCLGTKFWDKKIGVILGHRLPYESRFSLCGVWHKVLEFGKTWSLGIKFWIKDGWCLNIKFCGLEKFGA